MKPPKSPFCIKESPEVACLIHGLGRTGRDMTLAGPLRPSGAQDLDMAQVVFD